MIYIPIVEKQILWSKRGKRGSSEEHLTVTQFKVQQEQARLAELTEQNRQQEQQAATLGRQIEKIRNQ